MGGIGGARIFGAQADPYSLLGADAMFDAIVATAGGDYTLISDACNGETADAKIGVAPGDYTETTDINMKSGQSVTGLGAPYNGPNVTLDDCSWNHALGTLVEGLKIISESDPPGADYDREVFYMDNTSHYATVRDVLIDIQGTEAVYSFLCGADYVHIQQIRVECNDTEHTFFEPETGEYPRHCLIDQIDIIDIVSNTAPNSSVIRSNFHDNVITNIYTRYSANQNNARAYVIKLDGNATAGKTVGNIVENIYITCGQAPQLGSGIYAYDQEQLNINNVSVREVYEGINFCALYSNLNNYSCEDTDYGLRLAEVAELDASHCSISNLTLDCNTKAIGTTHTTTAGWGHSSCVFSNISIKSGDIDIHQSCANNVYSGITQLRDDVNIDGDWIIFDAAILFGPGGGSLNILANANKTRISAPNIGVEINDAGANTIINGIHSSVASDPTANNDFNLGYVEGDKWINQITGQIFECVDNSAAAAIWVPQGSGGTYVLTTDTASPVTCVRNNQYDNDGAGGAVTYNLPAPTKGDRIRFINMENEDLIVQCAIGDTIQLQNETTTVAGTATSDERGDVLELIAMDADTWYAVAVSGGWVCA